jgi:hypothetical protein
VAELNAWERITTADLERQIDVLLATAEAARVRRSRGHAGPVWTVAQGAPVAVSWGDPQPLSQPISSIPGALAQMFAALSTGNFTVGLGGFESLLLTIPGAISVWLADAWNAVSPLLQLMPASIVFSIPQPPG